MKTITLSTGITIKADSNGNIKSMKCKYILDACLKPIK
jgi:hypothetical protein